MSLVSLADLKSYLGITTSDQDDLLQDLIDRASAEFEKVAKRVFSQATYTDLHDGGHEALILRHRPIISVTSVIDYANPDSPLTLDSEDYVVYQDGGYIQKGQRGTGSGWPGPYSSDFPYGLQRWEIEYEAGYTTIPGDIEQAVIFAVQDWYGQMERDGAFQSERIGDYSYTIDSVVSSRGLPARTYQTALRYREDTF